MIGKTVRAATIGDSGVAAIVVARMYPLVYPANPTFPVITYRVISGYKVTDDVNDSIYVTRLQLDIWGTTYNQVNTLKKEVMRVWNRHSSTTYGQRIIDSWTDLTFDQFEQNLKIWRAVVDIRVTHEGD